MPSDVIPSQPISAYTRDVGNEFIWVKVLKDRSHLDTFNITLHKFCDFKSQLLLRDGLTNVLVIRRRDLAIALVKVSTSQGVVGLTLRGFPIARPED